MPGWSAGGLSSVALGAVGGRRECAAYPGFVPDSSRLLAPARAVLRASVSADALDLSEFAALVASTEAGAFATFAGVIRNHDHGLAVVGIDYVAHPGASAVLADIAATVCAIYPLDGLCVSHRIGTLAVGDVALAAAVSAAHRHEAFAAISELVEQVKLRLPVWKHQHLADGSSEWVGCP